jgi:hypothetical protein
MAANVFEGKGPDYGVGACICDPEIGSEVGCPIQAHSDDARRWAAQQEQEQRAWNQRSGYTLDAQLDQLIRFARAQGMFEAADFITSARAAASPANDATS